MHNTQSRLPVNDNDVVTSIATIGTFEAVVFFSHTLSHLSKGKIESYLAKTLTRWPLKIKILNEIVTGDWTWCFAYDPETKRRISEWVR